jgi:hypothetical protein
MEQDANDDKAVGDLLAQENSTDGDAKDAQVDERNRNNEVVGMDTQDQYKWQPRRPI